MIEIAIVEDEQLHATALEEHLLRFARERSEVFHITHFQNAVMLLENYSGRYDVIFMDIRMPYLNGMAASQKLRELDEKVILVFITSLTQYAVQGYEVGALAYIVKPIAYEDFALKFSRVYRRLQREHMAALFVPTENGTIKLDPEEIAFCEVSGHKTVFHSIRGDFEQNITLRSVEEKVASRSFIKCNHCYLVNLHYVKNVSADEIEVLCEGRSFPLQISRNKRKAFHDAWKDYQRGGYGGKL